MAQNRGEQTLMHISLTENKLVARANAPYQQNYATEQDLDKFQSTNLKSFLKFSYGRFLAKKVPKSKTKIAEEKSST